mgnify:CR=1 FL=1
MAFLLVCVFLLIPLSDGSDPDKSLPDLSITDIKIEPGDNHYLITVVVKNIGAVTSSNVSSTVYDEFDISTGEEIVISLFNIPSLNPGESHREEMAWIRDSVGLHRIWAVVDVNSDLEESKKLNNIGFRMVELPAIRGISAEIDGNPDPKTAGVYFAGVDLPLNISVSYSGLLSPQHMLVYMKLEGESTLLYSPTDRDGISHHTLNVGSLKSGTRKVTVNASSSGFSLMDRTLFLDIRDLPNWTDDLSHLETSFDIDMGAYVISGYYDVPTLEYTPYVEGVDIQRGIEVFGSTRDLMITAYVKPGGSTTVRAEGAMEIDDPEGKRSVKINGKGIFRSPFEDLEMDVVGSSEISLGLHDLIGKRGMELNISGFAGHGINPPMTMFGNADMNLDILMNGSGIFCDASTEFNLSGGVNISSSRDQFGFDDPLVVGSVEGDWSTAHDLVHGGEWSNRGGLEVNINTSLLDLGLASGGHMRNESVPETGISISTGHNTTGSMVLIPFETGSMSTIYYRSDDTDELVHQSNLHKSWPTHVELPGNLTLIAWSESGSYVDGQVPRFGSLGIRYTVRNGSMSYSEPIDLFPGDHSDTRTRLAVSPSGEEVALVWQRDWDGDPRTRNDTAVMFSGYNGDNFSVPVKLSGEGPALLPDVTYSSEGDLWVTWLNGRSIFIRADISEEAGWSDIKRIDPPSENGAYLDVLLSQGKGVDPYLIYVRSGMDREDNYVIGSRRGDPDRASLLADEEVISQSKHDMEDPYAYSDSLGGLHLVWRGFDTTGEKIFASRRLTEETDEPWLDPVKLTEGNPVTFSPHMVPIGEGVYRTSWFQIPYFDMEDLSGSPAVVLSEMNLSSSARIISVEPSDRDYEVGRALVVTVRLENTGLSPRSQVSVDLTRAMRDPLSGVLIGQTLQTRTVEFSQFRGKELVEFPVTVVEHQLGLSAEAYGSWGAASDVKSRRYLTLMAVQDPSVESLSISGDREEGENLTVSVKVVNHGKVSTGSRRITILMSEPQRPISFPGGLEQPPLMGIDKDLIEVNHTEVNIPPGAFENVEINFTLRPGITYIKATIEPYAWEVEPRESITPLRIECLPSFDITLNRSTDILGSSRFPIEALIRNTGSTTVESLEMISGEPPEGMVFMEYTPEIHLQWVSGERSPVNISAKALNSLEPGRAISKIIELEDPDDSVRNRFMIFLTGPGLPSKTMTMDSAEVIRINEGHMVLKDKTSKRSVNPDQELRFGVEVRGNRSFRGAVVRFYNGMVHDDVVISRDIITHLDSGGSDTGVSIDLDEGTYTVTLAVYGYPANSQVGSPEEMILMDSWTMTLEVTEPEDETPEEEAIDTEQLWRTSLISGGVLSLVFGIALAWRLKENLGKED